MAMLLSARITERWANNFPMSWDEAAHLSLSPADLYKLTGKNRLDFARTSARRLGDVASISVQCLGDITLIYWPKYAKDKEARARSKPAKDPSASASASASSNAIKNQSQKSELEDVSKSDRRLAAGAAADRPISAAFLELGLEAKKAILLSQAKLERKRKQLGVGEAAVKG